MSTIESERFLLKCKCFIPIQLVHGEVAEIREDYGNAPILPNGAMNCQSLPIQIHSLRMIDFRRLILVGQRVVCMAIP